MRIRHTLLNTTALGIGAISATFGIAAPAAAQSATQPYETAPDAPVTPERPVDIVQCERVGQLITCSPGTDPDGAGEDPFNFVDPADPLVINIEEGAFVEGRIRFGAVDGTNGTIVTNDGTIVGSNSGFAMATGSTVTNNGFARGNGFAAYDSLQDQTITNNGTIYGLSNGIYTAGGLLLVNNGLIQSNSTAVTTTGSGAFPATRDEVILNGQTGIIVSTGAGAIDVTGFLTLTNDGLIQSFGSGSRAIRVTGDLDLTNSGFVVSQTGEAISFTSSADITNSGTITGRQNSAIFGDGNLMVNNSGTIEALETGTAIGTFGTLDLVNTGTITSNDFAAVLSDGLLTLTNSGLITTEGDFAVGSGGGVDITNLAGGEIRSNLSYAITGSLGSDIVVNYGTLAAGSFVPDAVEFLDGDDEFQQWGGASVIGNIVFGNGADTFVLAGSMSSISGEVRGGGDIDTALISGIFDSDNLTGFENIVVGSLADARFVGDRTMTGDVSIAGTAVFDLGIDSLTVDGDLTLESGSTIRVLTSLDYALVGQGPISVLSETGTFTNNGTSVDIVDDDLFIDYIFDFGSLTVTAIGTNPIASSTDPNVAAFGAAFQAGLNNGTIDQGTLNRIQALTTAQEFEIAAAEALPGLSGGVAREIFENNNASSKLLDQHLADASSGIWGLVFHRGGSRDGSSLSINSYNTDNTNVTMGFDLAAGGGSKIGIMGSWGDIDVDEELGAVSPERVDVDAYKVGVYGGFSFADRGFLNAEVGYALGTITAGRDGFFFFTGSQYDYDGMLARATLGYDILPDENVNITPSVGVNYSSISFDDAQESDSFQFLVQRDDADFLEARFGLEVGAMLSKGVNGFIKGTVVKDFEDDVRSVTISSVELPTFVVNEAVKLTDRFELDAGITVFAGDRVNWNVGYNGEFADEYRSHGVRSTIRLNF